MTAHDDIAKGDRGEPEPSAAVGCVLGARWGRLGLHKAAPYPEPWDRRQLKPPKKDNLPACSEAPSPTVIKLSADPAPTAPQTLHTPRVHLHTRGSSHAALCAALLLLLQHFHIHFSSLPDCYGTLSALRCRRSPPGYPRLMSVLFTPLGKSVIFPSRWVLVPSDQLINYILVRLCSAFFDTKLPPSLHAPCSSQSGTGTAHRI